MGLTVNDLRVELDEVERREAKTVHTLNERIADLESGQDNADQYIYKLEAQIKNLELRLVTARNLQHRWADIARQAEQERDAALVRLDHEAAR